MSKIIFLNNPSVIYEGSFYQIGKHQVRLTFASEIPSIDALLSGFQLVNEYNGFVQTNREDYKYIYRTYEDNPLIVELCNDDVPYKEPQPVPPPLPYVPTEEELKAIFEQNKIDKISESKVLLATYLEEHPLISSCHNNKEGIYNITAEKQSLMASNYLTYTIAKQAGVEDLHLTWNESGKECEEWTEEEFTQIILETSIYVKPLVSQQQAFESRIVNCKTQEELDNINIVYASPI